VTRPQPLPDTWYSRDFLVLHEVARRVEADESLQASDIAEALGMDPKIVGKAGTRLKEDGYLIGAEAMGHGVIRFFDVTAKGRREVGMWPSPDVAADRLLAALQAAVANAPTEEAKGKARRALDAVTSAGRDFLVDVASGVVTGQITGA
jgi:Mn-dependent DtxR family transcriptional regulator